MLMLVLVLTSCHSLLLCLVLCDEWRVSHNNGIVVIWCSRVVAVVVAIVSFSLGLLSLSFLTIDRFLFSSFGRSQHCCVSFFFLLLYARMLGERAGRTCSCCWLVAVEVLHFESRVCIQKSTNFSWPILSNVGKFGCSNSLCAVLQAEVWWLQGVASGCSILGVRWCWFYIRDGLLAKLVVAM